MSTFTYQNEYSTIPSFLLNVESFNMPRASHLDTLTISLQSLKDFSNLIPVMAFNNSYNLFMHMCNSQ